MPIAEHNPRPARQAAPETGAANLPIVSEEIASPAVEATYERYRSHSGRATVPGILQCFATHPPLLDHMVGLAETMLFSDGALGREYKELLATFVSSLNHCEYCADSHGSFLLAHGGSEKMLEAALDCHPQSDALPPRLQHWLSFAAKVSSSSHKVTASDTNGLRQHGWSDLQIAETIHLTALFACFNRVVNAFGLSSQNLLATFKPESK